MHAIREARGDDVSQASRARASEITQEPRPILQDQFLLFAWIRTDSVLFTEECCCCMRCLLPMHARH
jgi:hypothetical protein